MQGSLHRFLSALHQRQAQLTSSNSTDNPSASDSLRCLQILNYWMDSELFDLPECPMQSNSDNPSHEAGEFLSLWDDKANDDIANGQLELTADSRLVVMFQCHRAGYILEDDELHPNYKTPLTYLAAQALIPSWDQERQTIVWTRSTDHADLAVNLATIRTLYRRCPQSVPSNMSLPEWVEARLNTIETRLANALDAGENESPFTSKEISDRLRQVNRELANEFWPDAHSREFMLTKAKPIESQLAESEQPHQMSDGAVTFRWRFCFYPKGNDNSQLGPFFVEDLEASI
uniref:hypothetical protein n=1 Tax=Thaumasiovibrio occultus TaxID=1891184 RepID=UPI00131DDC9B